MSPGGRRPMSLPGAEHAVLSMLAERQDRAEADILDLQTEVKDARTDHASLATTVKKLAGTVAGLTGGNGPSQIDWLSITDPDLAVRVMDDVTLWWDHYGTILAPGVNDCWPWHPTMVSLVLALKAGYHESYESTRAGFVMDMQVRLIPQFRRMLTTMPMCTQEFHHERDSMWRVHRGDVLNYARWWADYRAYGSTAVGEEPPGLYSLARSVTGEPTTTYVEQPQSTVARVYRPG